MTDTEGADSAVPAARRVTVGRILILAVTAVSLYAVAPGLIEVWSAWPDLIELQASWVGAAVIMESLSFVSLWALLRICLRSDGWFAIGTSHLSANAFSRVVPGGAATGGALQYRMLTKAGVPGTVVATGLTVSLLLTTATVLALPILTVPAARRGDPIDPSLMTVIWIGGGVLAVGILAAFGAVYLDRPLRWVGSAVQGLRNWILRRRPPVDDLPDRLLAERDLIIDHLQTAWVRAAAYALAKWLFEYGALMASLAAVGDVPDPFIVLLVFAVTAVLGMIPLTPGGLGFVEAGLTAMLVLIGVGAGDAALAALLFRLVSFWLPLPAGLVAYGLYQRRYGAT